MKIQLAQESSEVRSKSVSGQRLVNLYAEPNPEGAKYPITLYGTPGRVLWANTTSASAIYGAQVMGGNLYAISNNTVYKITPTKVVSTVGTITGTQGMIDLANNGTQMVAVTPDGLAFCITSASVVQIASGLPASVSSVSFMDGYNVFTKSATGNFLISSSYDATTIDAADIATAEESPDNLVRSTPFNNTLFLFGENSIEPYYDSGNADFPFEQIVGAAKTTRGLGAKLAVAQEVDFLSFLGEDRVIYKMDGYSPVPISTPAVNAALQGYSTIADAFAFIYTQSGHKFLIYSFPTANTTWAYDITTGWWHERRDFDLGRWSVNCCIEFAGKTIVGDASDGKFYYLDMDTYSDGDTPIERIVDGSVVWGDTARLTHNNIRLDMDAGVGLTAGQGSDPQLMMSYSDDGKKTWSNERWTSFGSIGNYKRQAIFRRLGQARERVYRFRITDPVKVCITGAYADVKIGLS